MKLPLIGLLAFTASCTSMSPESLYSSSGLNKAHREAAAKLLQVSHAESVLSIAYGKMEQAIANQVLQIKGSTQTKPIIDKYTLEMKVAMREEISWEKMAPPLIDAYVQTYSLQTIRDITRFYQTRAGQEMLSHQPEMINATVEIMQNMTKNFIPKLRVIQSEMARELTRVNNIDTGS